MPRALLILELWTRSNLQSARYTNATVCAVQDVLWHNSSNLIELFSGEKSDIQIDVEIACQKPEEVDVNAVYGALPYGKVFAKSVKGGLDIARPARSNGPPSIIAHAAIIVSFT